MRIADHNHTQIGLQYIPWQDDYGDTNKTIQPHPYTFPPDTSTTTVNAYAYSAGIILVYAAVIIVLICVQLRARRNDPISYYDDDVMQANDEKELLEEMDGEEEGRSLLRIDVERMSGLKDAHRLDQMPSERV